MEIPGTRFSVCPFGRWRPSSVAPRFAGCTESRHDPIGKWHGRCENAMGRILAGVGATCAARRHGADFRGSRGARASLGGCIACGPPVDAHARRACACGRSGVRRCPFHLRPPGPCVVSVGPPPKSVAGTASCVCMCAHGGQQSVPSAAVEDPYVPGHRQWQCPRGPVICSLAPLSRRLSASRASLTQSRSRHRPAAASPGVEPSTRMSST